MATRREIPVADEIRLNKSKIRGFRLCEGWSGDAAQSPTIDRGDNRGRVDLTEYPAVEQGGISQTDRPSAKGCCCWYYSLLDPGE
jgi:hypothetical protein